MSNNLFSEYHDKIAGGWKCVSFELFNTSGSERKLIAKPHGDEPLGRVSISPNGYLSALLAFPDRAKGFPSEHEWQTAPEKEVAYVARGLGMYCGHTQLFKNDDGSLYWQTKVEVSADPNWIGSTQERKVTLAEEAGKVLMILEPRQDLTLEVRSDGTKTRAVLKWEKFE